jgi:hypothetical protein
VGVALIGLFRKDLQLLSLATKLSSVLKEAEEHAAAAAQTPPGASLELILIRLMTHTTPMSGPAAAAAGEQAERRA